MEQRDLDKLLSYLPVITTTCDRYGWAGGDGIPVDKTSIAGCRKFFHLLSNKIPMKEIPQLEDIMGSLQGGIIFLWETELDPVKVLYDSFWVDIRSDNTVFYYADIETIGIKEEGVCELDEGLDPSIIRYVRYFHEQKQIQ